MKKNPESRTCHWGIDAFARLISGLLHPIFASTFLFWTLILCAPGPARSRMIWFAVASTFSAALPLISLLTLRWRGGMSDFLMPDRRQRTLPLLIGMTLYATGTGALSAVGAPILIRLVMGCYASSAAMATLVNLRWKISLHAVGAWGSLVALCYGVGYRALYVIPLAVGVAWARIRLGAHTPAQVLAGGGLGAFVTLIQMEIWT